MDIGKKIRNLRINANMTQQNLADKLHKTSITVRKYELNQISPPINVLCEIADIFNKPIIYFFDDTYISDENNIESSVLKSEFCSNLKDEFYSKKNIDLKDAYYFGKSTDYVDYLLYQYVSKKSTIEDTTFSLFKELEEKYISEELSITLSKFKTFLPVFKEINIEAKIINTDNTHKIELLNQKNNAKYILTLHEFNLLCKKLTLNIENEIKFLKYLK